MKCPKCAQEMTPIIYPTMPPKSGGYTCFGCGFKIEESDIIERKPKEVSPPKIRCATCENDINELRAIPEHNVFSDSLQYYRMSFGEGFIKALELFEKGAGA